MPAQRLTVGDPVRGQRVVADLARVGRPVEVPVALRRGRRCRCPRAPGRRTSCRTSGSGRAPRPRRSGRTSAAAACAASAHCVSQRGSDLALVALGDPGGPPELPADVAEGQQPRDDEGDPGPERDASAAGHRLLAPECAPWQRHCGRAAEAVRFRDVSEQHAERPRRARRCRQHDLRGDVRARRPHRVGQPRAGLPRPERSRRGHRGGVRRACAPAATSTRPGAAPPSCVGAVIAPPAAALRPRARARERGGDHRRHRGDRRCAAGRSSTRATRSWCWEPYYDSYRAMIQFAGGVRRPVTLRAPDYRLDPRRAGGGRHRADEADPAEHPAQPDRARLRPRRARGGGRGRPAARPRGGDRRGLRAPDLRGARARPDRHAAGDVRPHGDDLELGQDLLASPAGRSAGPPARPTWSPPSRGPRTGCRTPRARPSSRRSPRPSTRRTPSTSSSARTCRRSVTTSATALDGFGLDVHVPQGTYFVTTDVSSLGHADGIAFCAAMAERARVVAIPNQVFYEEGVRPRAATSSAGRSARNRTCWRRASAGCARPTCAPRSWCARGTSYGRSA